METKIEEIFEDALMTTPLDRPCPRCGAKVEEHCVGRNRHGYWEVVYDHFHPERIAAAEAGEKEKV